MTLTRRTILMSLALALVASTVIFLTLSWLRTRERVRALDRVSAGFLTELNREACEADAQWFLAGPRVGRPRLQDRNIPDADVKLPRPSAEALPFDFFAYDAQFLGSSVAAPRFPDEIKRPMRETPRQRVVSGTYAAEHGQGVQIARWTGWENGPCAVLLFRLAPDRASRWGGLGLFVLLFALTAGVALAAALPTALRVHRLARTARESVRQDYSVMAPIRGRDEIGALGSIFNDAAADIRTRITDAKDREEALRRYVAGTTEDIAAPLAALEAPIARLATAHPAGSDEQRLARATTLEAHRLSMRLQNLAAVAELRNITESTPRDSVDLTAVCRRVLESRATLAAAADVDLGAAEIDNGVVIEANGGLIELAVANLVDNAILYAGAGARVRLELRSYEHGRRFALRVTDVGQGVGDEEFAGLTANRRFRGDEARTRRPGERGLGLSLTREIADRFGLTLELRRPTTGGFEAEIATRR